jgi:hypothetical protein
VPFPHLSVFLGSENHRSEVAMISHMLMTNWKHGFGQGNQQKNLTCMQPHRAATDSGSICALLLILQHVIGISANGTNEASKLFMLLATSALADLRGEAQMATFQRSGNVLHGLIKPRPTPKTRSFERRCAIS